MSHYSDPARQPHQAREVAESFGSDADRYERSRTGYPEEVITRIAEASPGRDLVDVGCGTGIASRQFHAAGLRVLGVEPDERMAALARRTGIEVEIATIESWEPAGRRFDVVAAAQAWHWVDPVAGAAKTAAVLRPGGRFAAFWNAYLPPAEIGEGFAEVYRRVPTGLPFNPWTMSALDGYRAMCDKAANGLEETGHFGPSEVWQIDWDRRYTRDEWLDQVPTWGGHNQIPPAELDRLLAGLGDAVDEWGGSFTMDYATLVVTAVRL